MPYLKEELDYWGTPEFLEFTGKPEYRVLKFLMAHIIRGAKGAQMPPGAARIYRHFFKKKMLCASYSEKDIAKIFGWKSKGYVSDLVKRLEQMKMLHIRTIPTPAGKRNVYQLGFYKGTYGQDDYEEVLFFDVYFSGLAQIHKTRKTYDKVQEFVEDCSQDYLDEIENKVIFLDRKWRTQQ